MEKEALQERRILNESRNKDFRNEYQRDHARLIHSAAFRRLQSKTQILGLGESDFYRTRLTHSMEVAQIGTSINYGLRKKYVNTAIETHIADRALMNTICLAHDIGHPPFGHGGEIALNYCMREHGGFEGNGQTLRILSKLDRYSDFYGLNPTRRTLLGILKYPVKYSNVVNSAVYGESNRAASNWNFKSKAQKPPKAYFDCDEDIFQWVVKYLSKSDIQKFISFEKENNKHGKAKNKSLDTSIMDIADDISYGVHDLEDAIELGMIDLDDWNSNIKSSLFESLELDFEKTTQQLFSEKSPERKNSIGKLINLFITSISIIEVEQKFEEPLLKYNAVIERSPGELLKALQLLVKKYVIFDSNVQLLEFKGQKIIFEIFEVLATDPKRFLPETTKKRFIDMREDIRVICDFVAGMTDDYATRLYEKLFSPNKGSIFERL